MADHDQHESPNLEDLTPEEASRIIHSHRKVRYGTACWPCRQRKVKCDNKQPCENCVKREHPQLCSYKPNRSGKHGSVESQSVVSKKRGHSPEEEEPTREHSYEPKPEASIRAYVDPETEQVSRYLGQNSIPALLKENTSPNEGTPEGVDHIRADMRSILGLDNSAPFPLMSSKHLERLTSDISSELPSDREVMKLFRTYKEVPQIFWGFVQDLDDLESKLMIYLEERAKNASRGGTRIAKPVSASWLAILFAVMAVGSQYHDSPYHVRTKDAQKYIQISFHFLRIGNFLLRPNLDSISALLMTGFVLLNDMKAEASWALLGLTCRLAQSLGLHRPIPQNIGDGDSVKKDLMRRRLWWTCVWHDTLTSLSFDRPPMTNFPSCPIPVSATVETDGLTYLESMYKLCEIISQRLNPDEFAVTDYSRILDNCQRVESIRETMLPQLRTKESCKSAIDRLQYFAIRLHTAFILSVCCRPALRRGDGNTLEPSQRTFLADKCKENLTETVRMFLAMHQLSVIPTRSWAFTYHGLSSAVLLGLLSETKSDPEVRQLQGDLISALSATAAKEQASPTPYIHKSDKDIELSGPLSRALLALKNIYDHGSVVGSGVKKEFDNNRSGTRTPMGLAQLTGQPGSVGQGNQGTVTPYRGQGLDPHQDAAMAMAEMQNGQSLPDFSNMSFVPPMPGQPGVTLPDLTAVDPTSYIEPMELYDSIFWESPDPWNTGLDSMNFDFLAQPPPGQPPQQQFYF